MLKFNRLRKVVLLLLGVWIFLLFLVSLSRGEESPLPVLKTAPKTVAVFKNGLGFIIKEGEVDLKDGWAITEDVPKATLGTIWIGVLDKGSVLEEVIAMRKDETKEREVTSIEEFLEANVGKRVAVVVDGQTIEGVIKLIPAEPETEEKITGIAPERKIYGSYSSLSRSPSSERKPALIFILQTEEGDIVLNKSAVKELILPGDYSTTMKTREKIKKIKFKITSPEEKVHIGLTYLEKGISWVPSYLINIEDPEKARITMKSTLINDAEDLEDVNVYFVVGYPSFKYADVLSPLSMEQSLEQFIQALESAGRGGSAYGQLSNIMRQRTVLAKEFAYEQERIPVDYGYSAIIGLPGAAEEDLFLYSKKGVSLKKGERAYYHIFSDEVGYEHIYE